jgi:hypothetical protein
MPTTNTGAAAGAHPIELALVAGIAIAQALLVLIAAGVALVLTLLPAGQAAGRRPAAAPAAAAAAAAPPLPPPPSGPLAHPLHQLLAELPMAELRAACAAAGRRPGRSRTATLAALLA